MKKLNKISVPNSYYLQGIGASIIYLLIIIFFVGKIRASKQKAKTILLFIPSVLIYFAMTTGISLYMVIGVIEGYRGKKSAFVRTPKFGTSKSVSKRIRLGYDFKKESNIIIIEFICFLYGVFWITASIIDFNIMSLIYGVIITLGFSLSLFFKNQTFRWKS